MKIAFLVNRFPALSETFILNHITGLLDRGHEVDIYAYSTTKEIKAHADVETYNLLKRTHYIYASMPKNIIYRLLGGIKYIVRNFHKDPILILKALNVLQFGKDAAYLRLLYQIMNFTNNGPYDVIHCQFGPLGKQAITLKAVGAIQGKIITTFRGYDVSSYIKKNGKHVYRELFERGDFFLCVSKQIQDTLIELGCDEQKTTVHRSGVHIGEFPVAARKPRLNGEIRLLTVARLVEKKGVEYGIKAVAKALKRHHNIKYKIAGDGYLKDALQRLIEELKVCDNVQLIGWQQREQVLELLKDADIFIAPSVTGQNGGREGIPGAIMEALALGLPVLSTRHSGIPEVVQDGESGFLVPERDTEALAEKLGYLIEHPELWPEIGQKGREFVERHYDIDKLNDRLVEIYQRLANQPQVGTPLY
jgi:colanic acid/amylovoran biosynthesis glycosyltransferase